jgi:penicillin-binding protein 2
VDPADPRDLAASHAWFVGLAPASEPVIVVVVLVEHGGAGGKVAAPIARAVVDGSFAALRREERATPGRGRRR